MKKITLAIFWISAIIGSANAAAQVGIGTTQPQGALDVTSGTGGFLPPRVTLDALDTSSPIVNPQGGNLPRGTIVHHEGGPIPTGLYLWNGGTDGPWEKLATTNSVWSSEGNPEPALFANDIFIGTTDAYPFVVKTNDIERLRVSETGNVGIGTNAPTALMHLKDGHIRSEQTTKPTVAVTTPNGITAAAISDNSTDTKGNITTTGTNLSLVANTDLTIALKTTHTILPTVIITPANESARTSSFYVTSTTSSFHLFIRGGGADPSFNYIVIE